MSSYSRKETYKLVYSGKRSPLIGLRVEYRVEGKGEKGSKRVGIKEGEGGKRILGVWGGCEGRKKTTRGGYLRGETDGRGIGERGWGKEGSTAGRGGWGC